MVNYIILDETFNNNFSNRISGRIVGQFNHINVFVGKNNSGKSRFLRTIFNGNKFSFFSLDIDSPTWTRSKLSIINQIKYLGNPYGQRHPFRSEMENFGIKLETKHKLNIYDHEFIEFIGSLENLSEKNNPFQIPDQIKNVFTFAIDAITKVSEKHDPNKNLYIPILRGLRPIHHDGKQFTNEDVYVDRTKKDYKFGGSAPNVYSGLSIYEDIKKLLLGTEEERELIADFQRFLSAFIFKDKVTLIPKYDADVLLIKIGDKPQHEIYNLGDGLQTIIAILFPIFRSKSEEMFVFIEEPESHLHPEWQQKLLNALKYFTNHQFFISTHSTGFINDSDASIFSVNSEDNSTYIEQIDQDGKIEILRDLGYKPSDLLLSNFVLWVEGPSDKIYIRNWLKALNSEIIEGLHYSIMVIGGENYRHLLSGEHGGFDLSLLKSLNLNYGIILDSDKENADSKLSGIKQQIIDEFVSDESFCWITKKREIENYISLPKFIEAIKKYSGKTNINIAEGDFVDRCKVVETNKKPSYKSNITLPDSIFEQIQKEGIDAIQKIPAQVLKSALKQAVEKTAKSTFNAKKIEVAKEVVKIKIDLLDPELVEKMNELVMKILKANNLSI